VTEPVTDEISSHFSERDGVRLHYLDNGGHDAGAPLVFVPGMGDHADEYAGLLVDLLPRRALALDLRGRGRSGVPDAGWALRDHVADVDAIVHDAGVDGPVHVASYSRGTAYALGWAVTHPDQVRSVTIGDYGARQVRVPVEHRESFSARRWRGRTMGERMDMRAIQGVFTAGEAVEMWDALGALGVPVLVMHGTAPGALATDELLEQYRRHVPAVALVPFPGSGHDLWRPDPHRFAATLTDFLAQVDAGLTA
jgi:pimeloyl-ACP methyl ester carboxylesterase